MGLLVKEINFYTHDNQIHHDAIFITKLLQKVCSILKKKI